MKNTVLITGTSTGIGRETVKYFSARGWNVAATMRTPQRALHETCDKTLQIFVTADFQYIQ